MSAKIIHKYLLSSRLLFIIVITVFIAVRLFPSDTKWDSISLWGSILVQIGIAFFLLQLNHVFNIIKVRAFLPALFYLLLIICNPVLYYDFKGSLAAFCFLLSYYILFTSYQKPQSQIIALNISLLLVLGSLLWPPLLFFFPVIWYGFHHFKCFNVHTFFASLIGFVIVYLFIFTLSIFQGDKDIFFLLLPQFNTLFVFQQPDFTILEWSFWGFLFIIYIIIGLYLYIFNISERIWTISILKYLYSTAFFCFIFLIIQNEYKSTWGLITLIPIAFLTGHLFSHYNRVSVQILQFLFYIFLIGVGIVQNIGT